MLGAAAAFFAVKAFVNAKIGLFQHIFVGRACAALNLAHNPLHEDQLLDADALREIVAAVELVHNRRRSRDIVRPRSVRGITPKTRMGSSPSEDCGGLAGGGSTADPRSAGAMHVARTAVEAIATALLHGGTPAFLALEALVHAAAVLLRHAHVGRARVVLELASTTIRAGQLLGAGGSRDIIGPKVVVKHAGGRRVGRWRRRRARNVANDLHRRGQPWRGIRRGRRGAGAPTAGARAHC